MAVAGRVAIVPKGDYDKSKAYKRLDCVKYNNALYIAIKDVPAEIEITNNAYWMKSIEGGGVGGAEINDKEASTTTTYSSNKIESLISSIKPGIAIKIVSYLPLTDIDDKTIYLMPKVTPSGNNSYDEYMYINSAWELIGDTEVDLTDYYTKSETDEQIKALIDDNVSSNDKTYSSKKIEEIAKSGSLNIPPKNVTNISAKASDQTIVISWKDPEDNIIEGTTLAQWGGTKLIMKKGSAPTNESDGTLVLDNTVRDKYAVNGYEITGLENNQTYYFYFIPRTTTGTEAYSDENRISAMPAKVMLDDVTDISTSTADGQITVNWTNPTKTKEQDGVTATWLKTTVVVKADSQPVSVNDGTAYVSTIYSESTHTFDIANGKDYYIGFFIESDLGSITNTQYDTPVAMYAVINLTTDETTLYGKQITATYNTNKTITTTFNETGVASVKIPAMGEVTFTSTDGNETADSKVAITEFKMYEVDMSFASLVPFSSATEDELTKMINAYYSGKFTLDDVKSVWSVGDSRTVHLSEMSATGVGESHREQDVEIVILDFEHDILATPIGEKTKALITVGQKDCLMDAVNASNPTNGSGNTENGYMNSSNTNVGGWTNCARRAWCNGVYFNALPSELQSLVKEVNKLTSAGNQSSTINTTADKIFLASEIEILGAISYSKAGEGSQYPYYATTANRYKKPKWSSNYVSNIYWERSPYASIAARFCLVDGTGTASFDGASGAYGLAPCFSI